MNEPNKNGNRSFLDKFQGRTNKVGKSGVQALLVGKNKDNIYQEGKGSKQQQNYDHQFRKVDLDVLIPSNPEKLGYKIENDSSVKRRQSLGQPIARSVTKQDYIPSAYTPQTSSKDESLSMHPPSRSMSNSTNQSRGKYIFGKYLKLDKQALSHIEFMQSIEEKSFFKKNKGHSFSLN